MSEYDEKLPAELQAKLDEVELIAEEEEKKLPRFDKDRAIPVGAICFGLAFTLGIGLRSGVLVSLGFGVLVGLAGFITAGVQKPRKK
ncbi:MAG: hypothetical protein E7043_00795 [Lentisphaerae bacterium]|nr:hypothetical protein [Lentisphaerota bacterium]